MKYAHRAFVAGAATILAAVGSANEAIDGGWRGTLVTGAGTELSVDLVIRTAGDGYGAYLDGRRWPAVSGGRASDVTVSDGVVRVAFDALGAVFEGALADDGLDGHWRQPGTELPLTLVAYPRPAPAPEEIERFAGVWSASVGEVPIKLRFEVDELGELVCAVTVVPEDFTFSAGLVAVDGANMRLEAPRLGVMTASVMGEAMRAELRASGGAVSFQATRGAAEPAAGE